MFDHQLSATSGLDRNHLNLEVPVLAHPKEDCLGLIAQVAVWRGEEGDPDQRQLLGARAIPARICLSSVWSGTNIVKLGAPP